MRPAVVIADSFGRAWRLGQTDVAIGAAGLVPLDQWIGRPDAFGRDLRVTSIAVADAVAAAADLARAKDSLEPVVLVRGLERYVTREDGPGAAALRRPAERGPVPLGGPLRAARRDHHSPPAHQHAEQPVARAYVPVSAAWLADVLVRDVHPPVALRVQQHLLDQAAGSAPRRGRAPRAPHGRDGRAPPGRRAAVSSSPSVSSRAPAPLGVGTQVEALARPGRAEEADRLLLQPPHLVEQRAARGTLVRTRARTRRARSAG